MSHTLVQANLREIGTMLESPAIIGGGPGIDRNEAGRIVEMAKRWKGTAYEASFSQGVQALGGKVLLDWVKANAVVVDAPKLTVQAGGQAIGGNIPAVVTQILQLAGSGKADDAAEGADALVKYLNSPGVIPNQMRQPQASWILDEYAALVREAIVAVASLPDVKERAFAADLAKLTGDFVQACEGFLARNNHADHKYMLGVARYLHFLGKAVTTNMNNDTTGAYAAVRMLDHGNFDVFGYTPAEFHTDVSLTADDKKLYDARQIGAEMSISRLNDTLLR